MSSKNTCTKTVNTPYWTGSYASRNHTSWPIVRGKANTPTEFGAKLKLSIDNNGMVKIEKTSIDAYAYNESDVLIDSIQRYLERNGFYPERVLVDKTYRNRKNLAFCKENGIQISGQALGRPKKRSLE